MTQTTLGIPDAGSLVVPVPRPRRYKGLRPPELLVGPLGQAEVPTAIEVVGTSAAPAVPATVRRRTGGGAIAIDTALALAISGAAGILHLLPWPVVFTAAMAWPVLLLAVGRYRIRTLDETSTQRALLVIGTGLRGGVLALAASPWVTGIDLVALALLVTAFGLLSGLHLLDTRRQQRPRLVLAGRHRDIRDAMREFEAAGSHDVVAVCLTRASKSSFDDVPTYVGVDAAAGAAGRHRADVLVVLPGARVAPVEMRRLHWSLAGVGADLCVSTGLLDVTPTRTRVFATGGLTLVRALHPSLHGPRRLLKAVFERLASMLGLVVLMPALLTIGVLIRLDSSGAAIYRQERVGRGGRLFTMYKFRSMTTGADAQRGSLLHCNEADGVVFKIQLDPRVTRVGRWLRRSSIDEMPQLWNVVRGDMSLVGPRPALPEEVAQYDVDPRRRLVVKPGMTGLWQVSGRSDLSWAESVRLDVRYVDNWSLGLDMAILVRTIRAVLGHRGAY